MVPRKFNIVDFGGFDLASQFGEALPGIYDKIVDAHWNCVYIMCFGLKFAGMDIAPQYMVPEMFSDHITLNEAIYIDRNDVITLPGAIPPPVVDPLTVSANGVYVPPVGVAGFNPVTVQVPSYSVVHFMVGDEEVYRETLLNGEMASYMTIKNNVVYYGAAVADSLDVYVAMTPASVNYTIVQITLDPETVTREGNDLRIKSTGGSGIILSSANEVVEVRARWVTAGYTQVGNCNTSAGFPTVVTTGYGRGDFSSPGVGVDFTIRKRSPYVNFFIGYTSERSELLIYDFFN